MLSSVVEMDQSHGNGMGEWDPNNFSNSGWDHQFANHSVTFDTHHGQDHSYPNPEAFLNADAHIDPQMSGPESQQALYRPFDYYNSGDVWTGPGQTTTSYAQDHALPQGYYAQQPQSQTQQQPLQQQQQPPSDSHPHQTVDSRFALVDLPQSHDFPSHHLHASTPQDALSHGFNNNVSNAQPPTANGYIQESMAQWSRVPAQVAGGYAPAREYDNPLATSQSTIQVQGPRGSPSPYSSGHNPVGSGVPGYRGDGHPQLNTQSQQQQHHPLQQPQPHHQYVPEPSGAPQPGHTASTHLPKPAKTESLRTALQPVTQKPAALKPTIQQLLPQTYPTQTAPNRIHQTTPSQTEQIQPMSFYPQTSGQGASPLGGSVAPIAKRRPGSEMAEPRASAKKAKVADNASDGSPSLPGSQASSAPAPTATPMPTATPSAPSQVLHPQAQPPSAPVSGHVLAAAAAPTSPLAFAPAVRPPDRSMPVLDEQLIKNAEQRENGTWPGVPNLAIGAKPVQLRKGAPSRRYVVVATKGDRDPLFPKSPFGWTPAESFGNHLAAYQKAKEDREFQKACLRLKLEVVERPSKDRADPQKFKEVFDDYWKKLAKDNNDNNKERDKTPPEPDNTLMRLDEVCSIHPAFIDNTAVQQRFLGECSEILKEQAARDATKFMRLVELSKIKAKNPAEFNAAEFSKLRKQLEPMFKQLEAVINRLLDKKEPPVPALLPQLAKKNGTAIRLNNILIRLINISEINCPLTKAILRLFGRFTAITRSDLETWKLTSSKIKLEAQGDSDIKDLISAIFQIAAKNGSGKDSPARDMKPASTTKKAIKSTAKTAPASTSASASASLGAKRVREDDANGDGRSGKKQAIGASTPASGNGSTPATSLSAKLSSSSAAAAAAAAAKALPKTTTSASTTAPAAATGPSKRSLLLPGKAVRAPTKVPVKPEPLKADTQKTSASTEQATKAPAAKTDAPKPVPAKTVATQPAPQAADTAKTARPKASEPPKSSKFAALMAEIYEPAKVKAPEPTPVAAAADPNETEDQKKRRLRKEQRRRLGLRVTFKSDDRLVEIREFTRDPEEIRFSAPVRDARSENRDKMEGMALRKSHAGEIRPWEEPTAIDFEVIPQEKRDDTFVTRGGLKTFHTEQQKFNEDRETKELMVIYTDPADIPPTPKSPAYEPSLDYDDLSASVISLPETVVYDEIRQRIRERQHLGLRRSIEAALVRLDARSRPDYADFTKALQSVNSIADSYNGPPVTNKHDIQSLAASAMSADDRDQQTYQLLTSDKAKNYRDPEPYDPARPRTARRHDYRDAGYQKVADKVEDLFAQFSMATAHSQPAVQPTVAQQGAPDYTAAWAQYYAQQTQQQQQPQATWYNQQQQAAYTQPANPYQQPQSAAPAAQQQQSADASNQLSAILGALGTPSATSQPQYPPQDPSQIQAAVMALLAGGQQQAQAPALPQAADPQSAEYLLSIMNWAQAQGGGAMTTSSAPPIPAPAYAHDQSSAGSRSQQHGAYGQSSYGQSQQDREGYGGSDNRDRERDRDWDRDRDRDRHNNNRGGSGKGKYSDVPDHLRGINRSLIGTKLCTFYAKGQCAKGDKCTFRHE
ncbi:hypothetical protein QBC34DRAFT_192836 [Podospora aff. communis PSN243]|uniref:C3H1-type domain-containing protein n=1 Tax=Podospora aff. communis PSN243 TaxID=3040156 RepID=A0AAV9GZ58_9PEZI|nr:hypothetical protein QBC34DRAFT_192836 [Podospora aff. communis PSN243]